MNPLRFTVLVNIIQCLLGDSKDVYISVSPHPNPVLRAPVLKLDLGGVWWLFYMEEREAVKVARQKGRFQVSDECNNWPLVGDVSRCFARSSIVLTIPCLKFIAISIIINQLACPGEHRLYKPE